MAHVLKTKRSATPRTESATGQAQAFLDAAELGRREILAKWRWRNGRASRPVSVGRPTSRLRKVNGKWKWEKVA